jgi:hypothetical protein
MTFESDGIPFIINDLATCIISNVHLLFVGNIKPKTIHIETVSRDGTGTQYCRRIHLKLTNNANIKHTYDMPNAIYDPYTNLNILGTPFLGNFFGDQATGQDAFVEADGTQIASSSRRSHFIWDHGKNECHFNHPNLNLPKLLSCSGTGYFQAFCTRVSRFYDDAVAYAFSSAYTIAPNVNAVIVLDTESDDESNTDDSSVAKWYQPSNEAPTVAPPLVPAPPPAIEPTPVVDSPIPKSSSFDLGASLIYFGGNGSSKTVVYERAMPNNLHHTIC